jgi:hypothetical protein
VPQQYARGGSWNGGGWDRRGGWGQPQGPQQQGQTGGPAPQQPPQQQSQGNGYGADDPGWTNGQRAYGALSGYTGARGIVQSDDDAGNEDVDDGYSRYEDPDGYGKFEHGGGAVSGYTGGLLQPTGGPARSGYTGGGQSLNFSMFGYGMVGGQNPHVNWMGMWPGWGYGGYGGGYYGGYYGGYGGYRGGMRMGGGRR